MAYRKIKSAKPVGAEEIKALRQGVEAIIERVRSEGDQALLDYSRSFDGFEGPFKVGPEQIEAAQKELPAEIIEGLDFAIERVTAFAQAQMARICEFEQEMILGVWMGHRLVPVESCACYVPAGRYPCLTSAVMSMVPAKVAGVKRIVAVSSPGREKRINPAILYTMAAIGAAEIYCLGGAQAIAAMAYGTKSIKPVDLIVGPGNQYVMEAKRQVFGAVGIDFLAGPSECQVIADDSARADYIAADILAQCEHDPMARGSVVSTSPELAEQVLAEIERQLKDLSTQEVARTSWQDHGEVVVVDSLAEAAAYANHYAPEHLEVHTADPKALLPQLTAYGSLFLGQEAAEVFADKVAGTNHILPTSRGARYTGGLWVGHFCKVITHQWVDARGVEVLAPYSVRQGEFETMDAHRRAALIRLTGEL